MFKLLLQFILSLFYKQFNINMIDLHMILCNNDDRMSNAIIIAVLN